jgi:selenocysteine lyase/cysteine desulfurase
MESINKVEKNKKNLRAALKSALKEHEALCIANIKDRREYLQTIADNLKEREKRRILQLTN